MQLTKSQSEAMELVAKHGDDNTRLFILWYGGIRGGKTWGMVRAGIEHARFRENTNYIVGGFTLRSIINNIAPYFEEICKELDIKYKLVSGGINPRVDIGSNRFLFYGGDRIGRDQNVQGATASGLLLDEFELLNKDFVKQCEARISNEGALRIYTSNKGQPYSWAKKDYYDRVVKGEIDGYLIDTNPEENTFIGGDFWVEKESEYDDYYTRRFIDNEFAFKNEPLYDVNMVDDDDYDFELTILHSYGKHHFSIPVFSDGNGAYILDEIKGENSPVDVKGINRYGVVLVNSDASMLGRELLKHRYTVRGYSTMFLPHKYEVCQRAFASKRVVVNIEAKTTIECLETYSQAGLIEHPEVSAIESGIEFLSRMNRWE